MGCEHINLSQQLNRTIKEGQKKVVESKIAG
jgi:hypothetical protein